MSVHPLSPDRTPPVAVIGAGFSGTMAAIQLLEALPRDRGVLLCERGGRFARGLAFGTGNADHLLNVRASNMGAYPDRPSHFSDWLAACGRGEPQAVAGVRATSAGTFVPRGLYGRYLAEILTGAVRTDGPPRLHLVHDAVVDLEPAPGGYRLRTEGGQTLAVAGAVLAMGNQALGNRAAGVPGAPASRFAADPWDPEGFGRLSPHMPVLIVGTGLSMIDAVASLRAHGFAGPIVALSRRGLLSNVHASTAPRPVPDLAPADARRLSRLTRVVRAAARDAQAEGAAWHAVVDALRPVTDALWRGLPTEEQARFLRHLRPFWDVHRHRTAPPAAGAIRAEIARGSLRVRAGRILTIEDGAGEAVVMIRPRGAAAPERLAVQCILDATGVGRLAGTDDPLLRRLLARGLVRPGPFGMGLDADAGFRALGTRPGARLWALGPLLRGVLWECVAVPDIRNQAVEVAALVAAELDRAAAA